MFLPNSARFHDKPTGEISKSSLQRVLGPVSYFMLELGHGLLGNWAFSSDQHKSVQIQALASAAPITNQKHIDFSYGR